MLVYLLPRTAVGHQVHNLRAAFIAGLADGMNKESLLLQQGDEPVPLDCRDLVKTFSHPEQIDEAIADFAGLGDRSIPDSRRASTTEGDNLP